MPQIESSSHLTRHVKTTHVILGIVLFLLITGLWALLWVPPAVGL
jgi:hypothetical protein